MGLKEEWEDEDAVYDVIGEGEYASIVAKRREEGGQMHHQDTLHCMHGMCTDFLHQRRGYWCTWIGLGRMTA